MDNIWPMVEGVCDGYMWTADQYDESDIEDDDTFQLHYKDAEREEGQTDPTRP